MTFIKSTGTVSLLALAFGLVANGYSQSYLTNGLVAYYPLNGNASDASGNGNNGVAYGVQSAANRFGIPNSAFYFNHANSSVVIVQSGAIPQQSAARTFSFWMKADSSQPSGMGIVIAQGNTNIFGNTYDWMIGQHVTCDRGTTYGNGISVWVGNLQTNQFFENSCGDNWADTKWHHYVYTTPPAVGYYDGNYFDGVWAGWGLGNSWPTTVLNSVSGPLYIGITLNGTISDFRVYNRALSASEISSLYAAESLGPVAIVKALHLTAPALTGHVYQVQNSTNLINWSNVGSAITTTNAVFATYVDVTNWSTFFRVQFVQ